MKMPPVSEFLEYLKYDPNTGVVTWKKKTSRTSTIVEGSVAGCFNRSHGQRFVGIFNRVYAAGRLVFFLHHGVWPKGQLRYLDGDKLNLRIDNLQDTFIGVFDRSTEEGRRAYRKVYRGVRLKKKFGITLADYQDLSQLQAHVCAICKNPESETRNGLTKILAVDHNHQTGQVRGLLCAACNKGIGWFNEDTEVMKRAIDYLHSHERLPANVIPLRKGNR